MFTMVAVVATEEPQMAPKPAQVPMVARPTPPFAQPSHAADRRNRSRDRPEMPANPPMRIKSGMIMKPE